MATFRSGKALLQHQERRHRLVFRLMREEHEAMVDDVREDAFDLTSGNVSTKQLRRKGHPFARSRSLVRTTGKGGRRSPVPKLPINRQTGRLRRSLTVHKRYDGPRGQVIVLYFAAPHARFVLALGGTRRMVARGFWRELMKRSRMAQLRSRRRFRSKASRL